MILHAAKDLGTLIRNRRKSLGLTQEKLAEKVGVNRAWVLALERGKRYARVDHIFRTLKALDLALHAEVDTRTVSSGGIDLGEIDERPARHPSA